MKVRIVQTVNVSETQRDMLADLLDGELSARLATRAELQAYIWRHGEDWAMGMEDDWWMEFDEPNDA